MCSEGNRVSFIRGFYRCLFCNNIVPVFVLFTSICIAVNVHSECFETAESLIRTSPKKLSLLERFDLSSIIQPNKLVRINRYREKPIEGYIYKVELFQINSEFGKRKLRVKNKNTGFDEIIFEDSIDEIVDLNIVYSDIDETLIKDIEIRKALTQIVGTESWASIEYLNSINRTTLARLSHIEIFKKIVKSELEYFASGFDRDGIRVDIPAEKIKLMTKENLHLNTRQFSGPRFNENLDHLVEIPAIEDKWKSVSTSYIGWYRGIEGRFLKDQNGIKYSGFNGVRGAVIESIDGKSSVKVERFIRQQREGKIRFFEEVDKEFVHGSLDSLLKSDAQLASQIFESLFNAEKIKIIFRSELFKGQTDVGITGNITAIYKVIGVDRLSSSDILFVFTDDFGNKIPYKLSDIEGISQL